MQSQYNNQTNICRAKHAEKSKKDDKMQKHNTSKLLQK